MAIITGNVEADLAARPTMLKKIVYMILMFSTPMCFTIKCNPVVTKGPLNTFRSFQMLTNLNAAEKKVAMKAIKRNAYSAYNDQLVLSMFADEDDAVKRNAVVLFRQL